MFICYRQFDNLYEHIFLLVFVTLALGWLGSRVVSVLDLGAEGPGSNRSCDAVG